MNFFTKTFAALTLLVALPAQAAIVTDMDDSDVLIPINGTNWLQIIGPLGTTTNKPITNIFSFNDFDSIFDTSNGKCDVAGCTISKDPGDGTVTLNLTGFTWASKSEVEALFGSAGFDLLNSGFTTYDDGNTTDEFLEGLTRDAFVAGRDIVSGSGSNFYLPLDSNDKNEAIGGWFYQSTAVPEPSVIALFSIGLIGLGFARRRKSK